MGRGHTHGLGSLVARCLFPGFPGLRPPGWIRPWLDAGLGGVVLFARNVRDPEQLGALTRALRELQPDLLVAIDEEGGDVTRLEAAGGSSYPGNRALGVVDDVAVTEQVAAAIASDLVSVGVNVNLAPVADLCSNEANPIIGVRSFGSEPDLVARHVAAFVTGTQGAGVAACAKHFPGHGDTEQDSHLELPTVSKTRGALLAEDLVPFRAAIDAGVSAIMTAHIRVPAIEDVPGTLSRELLTVLLRDELGFEGMVITDAIEMRAVSATVGVAETAVRALAAGADALCLGRDLGPESLEEVRLAIVDAVREGRLATERLEQAAERVQAVALGVSSAGVVQRPNGDPGLAAARRALRSDGDVELSRAPFVVELWPEPTMAAGPARHGLGDALRERLSTTEVVRLHEVPTRPADLVAQARDRRLVLVVRDAHRHSWERGAVDALLAEAPDSVVVEIGLSAWRPDAASGYLATHGAGRANFEAAAERLLAGMA